jgi:glycosyltransferase involved in cell wall biosynthesis
MRHKIAIVVHGRFYAFDLARALLARNHDVYLFTNYPKWAVARFGFPVERVRSYWLHGVHTRVLGSVRNKLHTPFPEPWLHESFGGWAARTVTREEWDAVYCFSGVAEELFTALNGSPCVRWLVRASSHIRVQATILQEEERRAGVPIDKPSDWMIAREEREYRLADVILTVSSFAKETFHGTEAFGKVVSIPLGVDVGDFRAVPAAIEARRQRISDGDKLRVLYVGTKSFRKGLIDLANIASELGARFEFRLVGPAEPQAGDLLKKLSTHAQVLPGVPQAELPAVYAWGDLFIFPTVEDGFPVVLAQANASGLPILATTNCGASDFVRIGETGWILPIRSPNAFRERLEWCDEHREELAGMATRIHGQFQPRTWDHVARDYENAIEQYSRPIETEKACRCD